MNRKHFFLLILLIFVTVSATFAQTLEKDINKCLSKHGAIGVACAVVKDGEIVWVGEFGTKSLDGEAFTGRHDDIFRIASISKSFGATAIMQLVDEGKISLDDDAQKYLPFPLRHPEYPGTVITVRMLLNHTSSITYPQYFNLDCINPARNDEWTDCYKDWEPGTKYKYSNLGFNLVAAIVESASGERFDRYIKKHICDPLGMNASFNVEDLDAALFVPLYKWNKKRELFTNESAKAYKKMLKPDDRYVLGYDAALFSGAGGMKTSATDLAKYMIMHMHYGEYNGVRILSEKSSREMQTYNVKINNTGSGYGLGLRSKPNWVDGKTIGGHTGGAHGLHSIMTFVNDENWGTISIVNGCRYPDGMLQELDNILYKHFIRKK